MPIIKLPNDEKATKVIAGSQFVDGQMRVSKSELNGVSNVLCRFHGCTVHDDEVVEESVSQGQTASGSLAAKETKAGETPAEVAAETKPAAKAETKAK